MDIGQAVRQAIATGVISQTTINELQAAVMTSADTRSLAILADAVSSNLVEITEDFLCVS